MITISETAKILQELDSKRKELDVIIREYLLDSMAAQEGMRNTIIRREMVEEAMEAVVRHGGAK